MHFKQPRHFNNNLSSDEQRALNDLRAMKSIVIKHADKGSAIVIQDSVHYRNEALRQLNNDQFYISTPNDLTKKHQDMVFTLLHKLHEKGEIDDKVFNGLTPRNIRTARFYLLPKIHKCLTPGSVPGRPIISGNGCSTEKISSFVDEHIKPFVKTVPSYIRDTTDFINKLENTQNLPKTFFLVTLDVTSLNTNIPNHEGLTAVACTLRRHRPAYRISHQSILSLLKLVLHCNNFIFEDKHYLQIGGTAMGTKLAPSYANIFMGELESKMLRTAPYQPYVYLRYIDDIFIIWTGTEMQLQAFYNHCNQFHKSIKFTIEYSTEKITFLDTVVHRNNDGKIVFDLYGKPTDKHCYLHFDSNHPVPKTCWTI